MGKIQYGKCGGWITPVGVLLSLLSLISAQPGFLSIDCGGKTNRTDDNDITWVTDANYIKVGKTVEISEDNDFGSYLHTLRVFPKPLIKSCYQLPVVPDVPYLLRLWFSVGNYTGFKQPRSFAFSIETEHMLAMGNLTIFFKDMPFYNETIFVSSGRLLYICLIRTLETDDPFISAIELRMLQQGMYQQAKPGTMLVTAGRCDVGGDFNSFTRYPVDKFDRIWESKSSATPYIRFVRTEEPILINDTKELPPPAVMKTAGVITKPIIFSGPIRGPKVLLLLYFAEIDNISRSFNVTSGNQSEVVTSLKNDSTSELTLNIFNITGYFDFELVNTNDATSDPIINAFETYDIVDTQPATHAQDFKALEAIKSRFGMKDWISDPCFLIPWKEIVCKSNTSPIRISEIDLSGKNLTGLVPNEIGQLTALVKLSLGNNHFMGPLPNFSSLTMLERLYLQNNSLNGTFPFWLSELKNLKELNIGNNNISGVIPAQLRNSLVKFSYCGNPYLQSPKGACILHDTKEKKLKVILETTLTGIPIIALALIVAIVMDRNKFGRKEQGFDHDRTVLEEEPRSFVSGDYSMGIVPNPAKPRAFTLEELLAATHSFSREIGRGGFGSVFLGELPRGKTIAVKVLSQFSQQGVQEFLNEVDLLSRIHHRNLVCLLGYCKESKEVMLIYEYMSGGSLRDHLYGPSARQSKLNWRLRLKIALDAAQGLEYLHVGCTPRIIHRDVKTANILLDSNLNGKLADFGLSRMTNDGEASHVTTAVKGTFGYLDPEYYSTQMLTEKSDVYSFGVVLLEIISGRPPIDPKLPEEEVNIIHWATPYLAEIDENGGTITEIIDEMLGESYDMKSMTCVAKVAKRCVQAGRSCRPSMSEVVAELKEAIKLEDLLAGPVDSIEREGMEWSDDSCDISNVGR